MLWLASLNLDHFITFTLVLVRTSGLVIAAPIYGGSDVPAQVRVFLAFALALLMTPGQLAAPVPAPETLVGYAVLVGGEVVVGLVLGLGIMILLSGMQLAGQIVGQLSGMSLAEVFSPTADANLPLFSQVLYLFTLAVFVAIGGHRLVMGGLLDTFAAMPPGSATLSASTADAMTTLVVQSFSLGIRAVAPVTVALLLTTIVMGIISRTLPQLNVMSFGFGVSALATLGTLWVSLGSIAWIFQEQIEPAVEAVISALSS
jgi:flagellar biosynthetic protein FliR